MDDSIFEILFFIVALAYILTNSISIHLYRRLSKHVDLLKEKIKEMDDKK